MFLARVLLEHKYKVTGDCYVYKFLQRLVWTANVWWVFRVKPRRFQIPPAKYGQGLTIHICIITYAAETTYTIALSACKITNS